MNCVKNLASKKQILKKLQIKSKNQNQSILKNKFNQIKNPPRYLGGL